MPTVDVHPSVLVHRPRSEVAAFMFDPANDLLWTGGITSSTPAQPGRLVTGATVERTARFLGRAFTYGYVVTDARADELVEMRVEQPFPMLIRYELEEDAGGTRATIHSTGTPGGFFALAAPLMKGQVRRSIAADLARLKQCLENSGAT